MTTKDRTVTLAESDALRALPANRLDPQALISKAIEQGAGIETLERLVQLAKDIRAITAKEAFNEAIAEFQRRCPPIKKNKKMVVPGRPDYRYGDLGEILSTIAPLMGELGLSVAWRAVPTTKASAVSYVCIISHRLGHEKESGPCEIPYRDDNRMNSAQSVGSATTYSKRYSLCAALGISPEDDDDAGGTDPGGGGDGPPRTAQSRASSRVVASAPSPASVDTVEAPVKSKLPPSLDTTKPVMGPITIQFDEAPPPVNYCTECGEVLNANGMCAHDEAWHAKFKADIAAQSESLFPSPEEQERHALIKRIQTAGAKLSRQQRGKLKEVFLGDAEADVLKADVAALSALARHLEDTAAK